MTNPALAIQSLWPDASGRAVADLLGYSQAQWQAWTSGRVSPTADTIAEMRSRAARALPEGVALILIRDGESWYVVTELEDR